MLDEPAFRNLLKAAPDENSVQAPLTIDLPLPSGEFVNLSVQESSIMEPELAARFPGIRTWKVAGDSKHVRSGRIDFTDAGFHAMLTMLDGDTVFIDPKGSLGRRVYHSMMASDNEGNAFTCQQHGDGSEHHSPINAASGNLSKTSERFAELTEKVAGLRTGTAGTINTYRIAVAATGEFTGQNGGTVASAMSAITTVINRVNEIFQRDAAVKLILVANNQSIIYTDPATDPYHASDNVANLLTNQTTLDNVIGSANYDIGHVFHFVSSTSASGLAQLGSVCSSTGKAKGTSQFMRDLDGFATSMVAHEIGHQFTATHSYNSNNGNCAQRTASTSFEPGGGTTIMSYAGVCGANNVQNDSDPYFHAGNVRQIVEFVNSGGGASCAVAQSTVNVDPVSNAGSGYTIPANTQGHLIWN